MSTYCEHGRKSWKCRYCNIKTRNADDSMLSLEPTTDGLSESTLAGLIEASSKEQVSVQSVVDFKDSQPTDDTRWLLCLMSTVLGRSIDIDEGDYIVGKWLKEKYGIFTELGGPIRRSANDYLFFPSQRGLKRVSEKDFYLWLHTLLRASVPTLGNAIATITVDKGAIVNIDEICTIVLNGVELHVRREGDDLILTDGDYKKVFKC